MKIIVDNLKINVEIRADIKINKEKNPEYFIKGQLSDLKSDFKTDNYKSINNAFATAREQGLTHVVFNFTKSFQKLNITEVNRWVISNINEKRGESFKEIIFIYNEKAVSVTRAQIVNRELLKELQKIKANS